MLSLVNVDFGYRKRGRLFRVLTNVSFSFQTGKVYTLYGPSGVGKTTCLSLLGGLETPQKGIVEIEGIDIKEIGYATLRRSYVSYVFQDYHLFSYMTALENVELATSISKVYDNRQLAKNESIRLLQEMGIDADTMNRPVNQISGGQKQRAAIARALVKNSTYILADEPTGNLDKDNAIKIMEILRYLAKSQGKCIIIATHAELVCSYADVLIHINDGYLITEEKI